MNKATKETLVKKLTILDNALKARGITRWFLTDRGWQDSGYDNDRQIVTAILGCIDDSHETDSLIEYLEDCNYVWEKLHDKR